MLVIVASLIHPQNYRPLIPPIVSHVQAWRPFPSRSVPTFKDGTNWLFVHRECSVEDFCRSPCSLLFDWNRPRYKVKTPYFIGEKWWRRRETTDTTDDITVEGDLPFHPETTQAEELELLVSRTVGAAARLQRKLMPDESED